MSEIFIEFGEMICQPRRGVIIFNSMSSLRDLFLLDVIFYNPIIPTGLFTQGVILSW